MYRTVLFLLYSSSFYEVCFGFNLTVLHFNDFHARFEQTNTYSGTCTDDLREKKECFGGIARLKAAIDQERAKVSNSVLLKGGDAFQGTLYYTLHKWKVVSHFLNRLGMTAMSLGNHEFDDGPEGLAPFLESATFPILACNIDTKRERVLDTLVKKSVIHEVGGRKIGIIGYLTTETPLVSSVGKVVFEDEVEAIKREVQQLKSQGVNIFIVVGHSGFHKDQEIAEKVPDIDVVVGGHTNTFLYTGKPPSTEVPEERYPYVVTQPNGRKVPVVQAYAFAKYLGRLHLTFSEDGEVISMEGSPLLLSQDLPEDPEMKRELQPFKEQVDAIGGKVVGQTRVFLDGRRENCRFRECSLGNLATDALVAQFSKNGAPDRWSRVAIAVINGGGIRASIDEKARGGNVTVQDVRTSFPFGNMVDVIEIKGSTLKKMLEQSVSSDMHDPSEGYGGFLQVSGIRVVYDMSMPRGQRTQEVFVRCLKCRVPEYQMLDENEVYRVATITFLANGGDGYTVLQEEKLNHESSGILDFDAISDYFTNTSPVWLGTEQRIQIISSADKMTEKPAQMTGGSMKFYCPSSLWIFLLFVLVR